MHRDPLKNPMTGRSKNMDHKKFIQKVMASPEYHRGAMTKQAHAHGYSSALQFAHHVTAMPHEYSTTTRHRAQFLENIQRK